MMTRFAFLHSLHSLLEYLKSDDAELDRIISRAYEVNPWFYPEFTRHAINAISDELLSVGKCEEWLNTYPETKHPGKKVGLIMAGNIPLVGFHDLICVLACGHEAVIKLSDKDAVLPEFILNKWIELEKGLDSHISIKEKLEGFDAVIATGSNNSARYFEYYFRSYPHILRQHRNGVAVLTGEETPEELKQLGKDVFLYYGLGCRNISKIYVPDGYDFSSLKIAFEEWNFLADHNKYRNNLDYNYAIYVINQVPHINLGHLILKEDDAIASRIGCVHYSFYNDPSELILQLEVKRKEIQCLVSAMPVKGWEHILPGRTQSPNLRQYADGIDTIQFLSAL